MIVGIVGGMGPLATCRLFDRIIAYTPARSDQEHIHVVINSDPSIPDRTKAILGTGPSPVPYLVNSIRLLQNAGADLCVMPCITAHHFIEDIRAQITVRFIDALDELHDQIQAYPSPLERIGLLTTEGAIRANLFGRLREDCEVMTLDAGEQNVLMNTIYGRYGIKTIGVNRAATETIEELADGLAARGAQAILAGCTEVALGLEGAPLGLPLLDPIDILASAVVRETHQ